MMCTTRSPASTRIHSAVCSPSTPMMCAPASFSLSRPFWASAFTWRLESAEAMIRESYRLVSLRTSRTVMSWALMSSRAVTAMSASLLRRIRVNTVESVGFNIGQNGGGEQTGKRLARPAAQRGADGGGRDRLRHDRHHHDGAGGPLAHCLRIIDQAPLPLFTQLGVH